MCNITRNVNNVRQCFLSLDTIALVSVVFTPKRKFDIIFFSNISGQIRFEYFTYESIMKYNLFCVIDLFYIPWEILHSSWGEVLSLCLPWCSVPSSEDSLMCICPSYQDGGCVCEREREMRVCICFFNDTRSSFLTLYPKWPAVHISKCRTCFNIISKRPATLDTSKCWTRLVTEQYHYLCLCHLRFDTL